MNPHEPHITTVLQPDYGENEPDDRKSKVVSIVVAVLVHGWFSIRNPDDRR